MSTISSERLREILAGTEGVTPGPWERRSDPSHYDSATDIYAQGFIIAQTCGKSFEGMEARAAHVANCDPDTVKAIVTELLSLRSQPEDGWQDISDDAYAGRVLLLWKPIGGIPEHVELGWFAQREGRWVNTYGRPFPSAPDKWAPLAPFRLPPSPGASQ